MRIRRILLNIWMLFLSWIVVSVSVDTYILGGKLKHLFIAIANTTSSSPYSSDGQMNILIIIGAITGLGIAVHYAIQPDTKPPKDEDDIEKE